MSTVSLSTGAVVHPDVRHLRSRSSHGARPGDGTPLSGRKAGGTDAPRRVGKPEPQGPVTEGRVSCDAIYVRFAEQGRGADRWSGGFAVGASERFHNTRV